MMRQHMLVLADALAGRWSSSSPTSSEQEPAPMLEGLGRTQRDLLYALLHQPAGMSIDDLAQALAITRTAVRQHLAALERDGLVQRGATRPTGRRPEQLHQLTEQARELFPRQYPCWPTC
jgi:predicted ArsR family transcriptional regulator